MAARLQRVQKLRTFTAVLDLHTLRTETRTRRDLPQFTRGDVGLLVKRVQEVLLLVRQQ